MGERLNSTGIEIYADYIFKVVKTDGYKDRLMIGFWFKNE